MAPILIENINRFIIQHPIFVVLKYVKLVLWNTCRYFFCKAKIESGRHRKFSNLPSVAGKTNCRIFNVCKLIELQIYEPWKKYKESIRILKYLSQISDIFPLWRHLLNFVWEDSLDGLRCFERNVYLCEFCQNGPVGDRCISDTGRSDGTHGQPISMSSFAGWPQLQAIASCCGFLSWQHVATHQMKSLGVMDHKLHCS